MSFKISSISGKSKTLSFYESRQAILSRCQAIIENDLQAFESPLNLHLFFAKIFPHHTESDSRNRFGLMVRSTKFFELQSIPLESFMSLHHPLTWNGGLHSTWFYENSLVYTFELQSARDMVVAIVKTYVDEGLLPYSQRKTTEQIPFSQEYPSRKIYKLQIISRGPSGKGISPHKYNQLIYKAIQSLLPKEPGPVNLQRNSIP